MPTLKFLNEKADIPARRRRYENAKIAKTQKKGVRGPLSAKNALARAARLFVVIAQRQEHGQANGNNH